MERNKHVVSNARPDRFGHLSVLIVDDDELIRKVLRRMLTVLGIGKVHVAASATSALDSAIRLRSGLDVIISDLDMPGIDGLEFLRRLSEQSPRAAVLILSGKAPDILRSVELMAREYGLRVLGALPKPTTTEALGAALDRYDRLPVEQPSVAAGVVTPDDVKRAVLQREFALFYQPRVDVSTRRVCGVEALVRWRHPTLGLLPPALFLHLVEGLGLMFPLTIDLIEEAAAALHQWNSLGLDLSVSVNVSQSCLAETSLSTRVLDACARHAISPRKLIVEVTETVAMTDVAHCLETLARLRMNGVGLAIDDFGTGHSSFQQLTRVPFTEIKIDRSFVTGASGDAHLRTIVESNVRTARALGLVCAGEGVETCDDWGLLHELGCDIAQGYFISPPMEGADVPVWVMTWDAAPSTTRE